MTETMRLDAITVGPRFRRDVGDIRSLAESIQQVGLLHPIVVTPDGRLIAGERRFRACWALGWEEVPVHVVYLESLTDGEVAENFVRKNFLPSEIEAIRRARAEKVATPVGRASAKMVESFHHLSPGKTRDKIGEIAGVSGRTVEKIAAVVAAAEADPARFGKLLEDMDRSGRVDRAHKILRTARDRDAYEARREQGGKVEDLEKLAKTGYRASAILSDVPWTYQLWSQAGMVQTSPENHYQTMSTPDVIAFGERYVAPLAAEDCVLFFWATWPLLEDALAVIKSWGFTYKTDGFVWVKTNKENPRLFMGNGFWTRANTEPCLLATRGNPRRLDMDVHQIITAPVADHSAKPAETHNRIERLVAGPYLELFARRLRPGWLCWGDEVPTVKAAAE